MSSDTTHDTPGTREDDAALGARMMAAIVRGVAVAVPLATLFIMGFVYVATDKDLADSFATATVSGVLLGVFAGGFVGVVRTMH